MILTIVILAFTLVLLLLVAKRKPAINDGAGRRHRRDAAGAGPVAGSGTDDGPASAGEGFTPGGGDFGGAGSSGSWDGDASDDGGGD